MKLNFDALKKSLETLKKSLELLETTTPGSTEYEVFRNSVVKSFELSLEMAGKSTKRALKDYVANPKQTDYLTFKDIFRTAAKHGLIKDAQPWLDYRDSRNDTVHDYGEHFATIVLSLIKEFLNDAENLLETLIRKHGL